MNNLLANLPVNLRDEVFEDLLRGEAFRVERIVSLGHTTAPKQWYDQVTAEWVILLSGAARLRFEQPDSELEMRPGDCCHIAAHQRHRVEWTDPERPTIWLAIHYQPSPDDRSNEGTN